MREKYIRNLLLRLGISAAIATIFMMVCLLFMQSIEEHIKKWFSANISDNENVLVISLVFFFFIISMSICVISYMWISLKRTSYVRKINSSIDEILKGDFFVRIPENGHDELTYLAASMNSLVEDCQLLIEREKEQDRRQQEFITQIAHDLRTPLTSVMGYLKLIEKDVEMDPDQERRYLGITVRKAEQLQKLIEELFMYMKLCDDDLPIQKVKVDLLRLVEQVVDEMYPIFEKNGMECIIQSEIKAIPYEADGALMARLFDNLFNNAIKYGKEGKKLLICAEQKEDFYVISVTNYGNVIEKEDLNKIFEKFYRTDQSRSSETGGTGLGLAIAANIVRLHGGRINCTSDAEKGTSFIISLPIR